MKKRRIYASVSARWIGCHFSRFYYRRCNDPYSVRYSATEWERRASSSSSSFHPAKILDPRPRLTPSASCTLPFIIRAYGCNMIKKGRRRPENGNFLVCKSYRVLYVARIYDLIKFSSSNERCYNRCAPWRTLELPFELHFNIFPRIFNIVAYV